MNRALGTLIGVVVGSALLMPSAQADYTATLSGSEATFTGDGALDSLEIRPGFLVLAHDRFDAGDAGFESDFDFDSSQGGEQVLPIGAASQVTVDAGSGNDFVAANFLTAGDINALVTASQLTVQDAVTIRYDDTVETLSLVGGSGDDEVDVLGTRDGTDVTVATAGGTNTVTLGAGTLDGIRSFVQVFLDDPSDRLVADDSEDPNDHSYLVEEEGPASALMTRDGDLLAGLTSAAGSMQRLLGGRGDDRIELGREFAFPRTIHAGAGDDVVVSDVDESFEEPFTGAVSLDGGPGTDTLDYRAAPAGVPVELDLAAGVAPAVEELAGWENAVGGAGDDNLGGDGARNSLRGGAGDDRLTGRGGKDRLKGQGGRDNLSGGGKDDRLSDTKGRNRLTCGGGKRDSAVTNRKSSVKPSCEQVRRRG